MKRAIVALLALAALVGLSYVGVTAYNDRGDLSVSEAEDAARKAIRRSVRTCPPNRVLTETATIKVDCTLSRGEWLCTYNNGSSSLSFPDDEHPEVSLIC